MSDCLGRPAKICTLTADGLDSQGLTNFSLITQTVSMPASVKKRAAQTVKTAAAEEPKAEA